MTPNYTWEGDSDAALVTAVWQYLDIHLPSGYYAVTQPYVVIDAEGRCMSRYCQTAVTSAASLSPSQV